MQEIANYGGPSHNLVWLLNAKKNGWLPRKKHFNVHSFLSSLSTKVTCSLQAASSCLWESYEEKARHINCGHLQMIARQPQPGLHRHTNGIVLTEAATCYEQLIIWHMNKIS